MKFFTKKYISIAIATVITLSIIPIVFLTSASKSSNSNGKSMTHQTDSKKEDTVQTTTAPTTTTSKKPTTTTKPTTDPSIWDGKTLQKPSVSNGTIVINYPSEMAWVMQNQDSLKATKIDLRKDINMSNCQTKSLPPTITEVIGNSKTIRNLKLSGGLITAKSNIKITNLNIEGIAIQGNSDVGSLIDVANGNVTIENCIVSKISLQTSKGNAGGLIGKICRTKETDRASSLNVVIKNCKVNKGSIASTAAKGRFVGLLSGYDKKESLSFYSCTSNIFIADYTGLYIPTNQSCFLQDIKYDETQFLGAQTYYRGTVKFDDIEFVPKWDGKTTVAPLLANPKYDGDTSIAGDGKFAIYTSFDLAGARAKTATPSALYFINSVDMNGQGLDGHYYLPTVFSEQKMPTSDTLKDLNGDGKINNRDVGVIQRRLGVVKTSSVEDDNKFAPFTSVSTILGNGNTIHNLKIEELGKTSGAFILSASGTTSHKDLNFDSCCTVVTHEDVDSDAKAYGAILIASAGGSNYAMSNINITNSAVCALQKVGIIAGYVGATKSNIDKCTVTNCAVQNYECMIDELFDSGTKEALEQKIRVTASFYPHGEIGGAFGFVSGNATISNCSVAKSTIHATGQDDKMATLSGSFFARLVIEGAGYYNVPGRHVGAFIGDIRCSGTVQIKNCTVDEETLCTLRWDEHNASAPTIGLAYYVAFLDTEGHLYIDGKEIVLEDCNVDTSR